MKHTIKRKGLFLVYSLIYPFFALNCQAEIFKWVDDNGKTHFSDTRPEKGHAEPVQVEINSLSFPRVERNAQFALGSREVVMYSTTWCGFCNKARKFFRSKGIAFKEYDVEKSVKGKRDYARLNGRGVPIILVGDRRMNGFDANRFMALYRK